MPGFKGIEADKKLLERVEEIQGREVEKSAEPFLHPAVPERSEGLDSHYQASKDQGLQDFLSLGETGATPDVRLAAHLQRYQQNAGGLAAPGHGAPVDWAQEIFQHPRFLINSIEAIFPEMKGVAIASLTPNLHLGQGKGLMELRVDFQEGGSRTLLLVAETSPALAARYEEIGRSGSALAHRFGARLESETLNVFSVDFHSGRSVDRLAEALEWIVGIPGHPMNTLMGRGIQTVRPEILRECLKSLTEAGLISEASQADILAARENNDAARLKHFEGELQNLLVRLDEGAVAAQFRFFRETGFQQSDPRRPNVIFDLVQGEWVFKPIDYEAMTRDPSPRRILLDYDIFENRVTPGVITMSVRPWVWSFVTDKSGFFSAILKGLGEATGLEFLQRAWDEMTSSPGTQSAAEPVALRSLVEFLKKP